MQRMQDMAAGKLPHARPLLLFPEGTTTNGRYLLPFKTGAVLAGLPLQPVVIQYGEVGARRDRLSPASKAAVVGRLWAPTRTAWCPRPILISRCAQPIAPTDHTPPCPWHPQGRFSPSWEMIPAARHIFLIMANPVRAW